MNVTIVPSVPRGAVTAPPSKSMAQRLLLCAGLADGQTVIDNVSAAQDVLAVTDCLRALGADVQIRDARAAVRGADPSTAPSAVLPCRESAATLRFFVPLCLLGGMPMTLTGSPALLARPLDVYEALCRRQGLSFSRTGAALTVCGRLSAGDYPIPGDVSSQFLSGLLFALPLLRQDSTLRILPPLESRPYVALTRLALARFGIEIQARSEDVLHIPGAQRYHPCACTVEGDWSNAAYFHALNALGGSVRVDGLDPESAQGDRVCIPYLQRLREGFAALDLSDCPDLGPVLFAAAAALHGARFTGTRRLRWKESDRVEAMRRELAKCGVTLTVEENEVTVPAGALSAPTKVLESHNDHRIAMALTLLLIRTGGTLHGAEAVRKSDPGFFAALRTLGVPFTVEGETL